MYKIQKSFLVGFFVLLIIGELWTFSFAHPDIEKASTFSTAWVEGYTLILMNNTDIASVNQARDYVMSKGAKIAILSRPHVILGWVSPEIAPELLGKHGIEFITQSPVDLKELKYQDEQTLATASFFNSVASGSMSKEIMASRSIRGRPLINDALEHPTINQKDYLKNLHNLGIAPSPGNSDSMTGTVAVCLFFVESDGSIDPDTYTWNSTDWWNTYNRAASGLSWWASQAPFYGASVSFDLLFAVSNPDGRTFEQGYEPVLHSSDEDYAWINAIMTKLGYTSGDKYAKVTAWNTHIKQSWNDDWAFSVFIGYNPSPAPDTFTNGNFAYAHKGGPYAQLLFNNDGWGESNFGQVLTHETGHIFWACDEYYQANYGGCTSCGVCASDGPRPTILNGNCEYCNTNAILCMMRGNDYLLCPHTPYQIGWGAAVNPPSVTTESITNRTETSATLKGTLNPNGSETTYNFQWGTSTSYGNQTSGQSAGYGTVSVAVTADLTGLTPNTRYYYRLLATNSVGTTYGSAGNFMTLAYKPIVTTGLATNVTNNSAQLNGVANANSANTSVYFQYGMTMSYGSLLYADQSPITGNINIAVSKTINGLTPNTTYHYRIGGVNSAGPTHGEDMIFRTSAVPIEIYLPLILKM
jgi:hypothetical protein